MSWKPGKGWPTQPQVTYLASLITVVAAVLVVLRWMSHGRRSVT